MAEITIDSWDTFLEYTKPDGAPTQNIKFAPNLVFDFNDIPNGIPDIGLYLRCNVIDFNGAVLKNVVVKDGNTLFRLSAASLSPSHITIKNLKMPNIIMGSRSILFNDFYHTYTKPIVIEDCSFQINGGSYAILNHNNAAGYGADHEPDGIVNRCAFTFIENKSSNGLIMFFGHFEFNDCIFTSASSITTANNAFVTPSRNNPYGLATVFKYCYFNCYKSTHVWPYRTMMFGSGSRNNFWNAKFAKIDGNDPTFYFYDNSSIRGYTGCTILNQSTLPSITRYYNGEQKTTQADIPFLYEMSDADCKDYEKVKATGFDIWPEQAK